MLDVRITGRDYIAEDVLVITMTSAVDEPLAPWEPGAHIDVQIPTAPLQRPLTRQYSLCGRPEDHHWQIAVLRTHDSRGGSQGIHERLSVGDILRVGTPRNTFPLQRKNSYAILVAGGIGITPLIPMAWRLHEVNIPFTFNYHFRARATAPFLDYLSKSEFRKSVKFYSDEEANPILGIKETLRHAPRDAAIYTCGPDGLIKAVERTALSLGYLPRQLQHERFSPEIDTTTQGSAFTVVLRSTGQKIAVPSDKTVAAALEEAGVELPISCEQGMCGSCLTYVIKGVPDHRDTFLTEEEKNSGSCFTPCCSRSKTSELVIDL